MKDDRILMSHGGGGVAMKQLIADLIIGKLGNPILNRLTDSAVLQLDGNRICFTTDSFIVKPLFFRGGDIGSLAVYGTVNDLAVQGAEPRYISLSLIIEEGFALEALERILDSIHAASGRAGVEVVTGDTKVVERGAADGIYINTTGIGELIRDEPLSFERMESGDCVIINGTIGDHGIAVISQREGLEFETPIESDAAPLNRLIGKILRTDARVRCMRDPTRGGVAAVLNEMAEASGKGILLHEERIPVRPAVTSACEMLGFDVLSVANEGKVLLIAHRDDAERIIELMREDELGKDAAIIGEVVPEHPRKVSLLTRAGGRRIVQVPYGEQLPRIC